MFHDYFDPSGDYCIMAKDGAKLIAKLPLTGIGMDRCGSVDQRHIFITAIEPHLGSHCDATYFCVVGPGVKPRPRLE